MTGQRALKQLVRERMTRTGESYTTAHRHVTARRAGQSAPPPGTVPGYPRFGFEQHRVSGLARSLLGQAGLPVSEAMACGLGGGIGFLYAIFEYESLPHPLLTVVTQHHPQPWPQAVGQHTGLAMPSVTSASATTALRKLTATLDGGQAAWICVGRGHLPWHADVPEVEAADPYPVVVAGRDGAAFLIDDGFLVDDGSLVNGNRPHRVDEQILATAWAAHRKGRFAITTVAPVSGAGPDLDAAVRAALATTHAHLTGPVLGHSFDVNFGLSGMDRMLAQVRDERGRTGWHRRFARPQSLASALGQLAGWLTDNHGAPGGTRLLFADFLREAGRRTTLDLAAAADLASSAGAHWAAVADFAAASAAQPPVADTLAELAQLLRPAVATEHALAGALGTSLAAAT